MKDLCLQYNYFIAKKEFNIKKDYFEKGISYERQMNYDFAIHMYKKVLSIDKFHLEAKERLYHIYRNTNKTNKVNEVISELLKYNNSEYIGYHYKFNSLMEEGKFEEAEALLLKISNIFRNMESLKLDYITYLVSIEKYKEAKKIINSIEKSNCYYGIFNIRKVLILLAMGKKEEAISLLFSREIYDKENIIVNEMISLVANRDINVKSTIKHINRLEEKIEMSV
ncbi:hypothetical protein CM240_0812 [Clostridium bornimense]|uniref:Uncharacterized protein n=1 Tax=Clostridium bornimense TaxID=1216932 RepID=W6S117_9CLOT|nr:tetratricopeptide repeat protein [Clostridium bornimense]CDM67977.1 hypothetical protein CM240_0812 [Clostridium bornimense]